MPRLLLVLGSRGAPVDGLLRSLAPVGEVVVLTSSDVLGERVDRLSPAVTAIVAPNRQAMVSTALGAPISSARSTAWSRSPRTRSRSPQR